MFYAALFAAALLLGGRMLNLDGDLPRHLRMGEIILASKKVPQVELFVYPYLNRPYVQHEWLMSVVFYSAQRLAGLAGVTALAAFLLASAFTLLYADLSARLEARLPVLILVAWGALASSLNWAARPHLVSMLLLALWLTWADKLRRGEEIALWRFPALMILWANAHGEFIAGILVLLAYAVGWAADFLFDPAHADSTTGKRLWLTLILSFAATSLNPGGFAPWRDFLRFVGNRYLMSRMMEANAPDFQAPELRVVLLLILFSVFLLAVKRERLSAGQGILLAGFTALALIAFRNIHLYGIVAPFVLAETLAEAKSFPPLKRLELSLRRVESQIKNPVWLILSTVALTAFALSNAALYQFSPRTFPVHAADWLLKNPQAGGMFNDLNWGGYLEWRLKQPVFADSVADKSGELTRQYETAAAAEEGWREIFARYEIEWAIARSDSPLAEALQKEGWRVLYQDETAVVLRRR